MDGFDVLDVDVDHRGRKRAECSGASEAFTSLAQHDHPVVSEQELVVRSARTTNLRKAQLETEGFLEVRDSCCCVLVQKVGRYSCIARRRVFHRG